MDRGTTLERLMPGARVSGLLPGEAVTVVAVQWHGQGALTLTFRSDGGQIGERLVYRGDEAALATDVATSRPFAFDADGAVFRLAAEARRIRMAYLFDPLLAVHLSLLEPLPHQIQAVYGEMLPRQPLRFLLADDPGAGKTIMAGLYIKELLLRGDLARCLIVVPGGLVSQWQDELADKFGLSFDIVTRDAIEASKTGNPFAERNLLITRLDHLARRDDLQEKLAGTDWDLVVVDEAHRMSAHYFGSEVKETRRYRLGKLLGGLCRHLLLMTATPHAGKEEDFQLFMALIDGDRFEGRFRDGVHTVDTSDLMRRMIKEKLLRFDGRPLFPERKAYTVAYPLSPGELVLYDDVTAYVREEMNRVDRLNAEGEGRRGNRVGFALTILQRRLASSPEAIFQSLARRRKRLEAQLAEERSQRRAALTRASLEEGRLLSDVEDDDDPDAYEDLADDEIEDLEEALVDGASAARTVAELETEIGTLARLEDQARALRLSGVDRKWAELSSLLADNPMMRDLDGRRRKLLIFTEHRDTLNYLVEKLRTNIGRAEAVVAIHGGVGREQRSAVQETFTQDKDCLVLVATDAAGEGINLQRAHLVVNYDLPWNPNRIEQRFGRVHRIGQTEVCHMWNLVAEDTREGQVYLTLLGKLEEQREALGGQVFDVLGEALEGRALRDLLIDAIRYGDLPETRARMEQVIDERVGDGLAELVQERALASDVLGDADVERIRKQMEEAAARRLQPRYVQALFLHALDLLGGRAVEREGGRFEITHVPSDIRARDRQSGTGAPVLARYERVCFERDLVRVSGRPLAELLCPGHPLLDVVVDLIAERYGAALRQGAVLVDDNHPGDSPWLLVFLEHAIADGRVTSQGQPRVVSRRFQFATIGADGVTGTTGSAPYLDFRPVGPVEKDQVASLLVQPWLTEPVEARAIELAVEEAIPAHLSEVRERTIARVEKVRAAVQQRLQREITHWDHRANELLEQVQSGRQPRMNPDRARARADELQSRLKARLAELDREEALQALPPVIVGAALVVPAGLLDRSAGDLAVAKHAKETARVERLAVDAALATERLLGRHPEEMPPNNPGFDIRSETSDGHLLFVEVKGRVVGGDVFTATCNEIRYAHNAPDTYVLAMVEVGPEGATSVRYLRRPFDEVGPMPFDQVAATFKWASTWGRAGEPT